MGRLGRTPILQDGGVQEAKREVPPRLSRAEALLVTALLAAVLKAATSGLVVLQVRGALVRGGLLATPHNVSTAMAVMGILAPLFTVIEFPAWFWPPIWGEMALFREGGEGEGGVVAPGRGRESKRLKY